LPSKLERGNFPNVLKILHFALLRLCDELGVFAFAEAFGEEFAFGFDFDVLEGFAEVRRGGVESWDSPQRRREHRGEPLFGIYKEARK